MRITIAGYTFEGPFTDISNLKNQSGVYVILGKNGNDIWRVLDVGESDQVKSRLENHDRQNCWEVQNFESMGVAVLYVDANSRMVIEAQVRNKYSPPCGER